MKTKVVKVEYKVVFEIDDNQAGADWSDEELNKFACSLISSSCPTDWTSEGLSDWSVKDIIGQVEVKPLV